MLLYIIENSDTGLKQMNSIFYYQLRELIFHQISSEDSPLRIILASSALGMGADFGRVERIVHAGPPKSIEGNFLMNFIILICIEICIILHQNYLNMKGRSKNYLIKSMQDE